MGGSSFKNHYDKLLAYIQEKGLTDKILLLQKVSNPYAIVRVCDYFVLNIAQKNIFSAKLWLNLVVRQNAKMVHM